ncbi:biliverdin-producing heme oxygenase [Nibrella saemangeumensis]|uniref:Biliverdin-producing heme oxygenase n=1 Tax=Nibrella saemangeumensis TaxID=1084526 RepID=A0ABP8N7L9_9BACT
MARLRQETQLCHEQVEKLLYAEQIQNGTLTNDQYIQLLYVNLSFHQPLEMAIRMADPAFFAGYDPFQRSKAHLIIQDLQMLRLPVPATQRLCFHNWTNWQLLGAAYVAEGSTLGGRVISKCLQKNPSLCHTAGQSRFYAGYGDQTGYLWKTFCAYLPQQAATQEDQIVQGAIDAFQLYEHIFYSLSVSAGPVAAL